MFGRSLLAVALICVAAAACGGSTSSAPATGGPSSEPSSVPSTAASEGPSVGPSESTAAGDGSAAFQAATTALDALDSYSYEVDIESTTVNGSITTVTHNRMGGTVVNRPEAARLFHMESFNPDGTSQGITSILTIGADAWMTQQLSPDEFSAWEKIPAAQANGLIASFAAFRPEQMFGVYFAGFGGNFHDAGIETKNGVETTHYIGDEAVGSLLGSLAGIQGNWSSDAWIANDGGYLVHSEASAEGAAGGGTFKVVVDITEINATPRLDPPD